MLGGSWLPVFVAVGQLAAALPPEPTAVRIEVDAPSGCSSADAFYEGVHGRTDRVRWAVEGESAVQIRIRLFRAGTKIRGELRLSDQEGEKETRKVDGATCDEVVEALALTVTLALDPNAIFAANRNPNVAPGEAADRSSAVPAAGPLGPPPTSPPPRRTDLPERATRTQVELGAQFIVANIVSNGLSAGPAIAVRIIPPLPGWGSWSLGMTLLHLQDDLLRTANQGTFSLNALEFTLCPLRSSGSSELDVGLCAAAMGGWLHANGLAFSYSYAVGRSWWSAGLQGTSSLKVAGALRLHLAIGADVPLIRREFTINEPAVRFAESPWLVFQGAVGLAYRF